MAWTVIRVGTTPEGEHWQCPTCGEQWATEPGVIPTRCPTATRHREQAQERQRAAMRREGFPAWAIRPE